MFRKRIHDGELRVPVRTLAVGHILPFVVTRLILDVGRVGVGGDTSKLVGNEQCGWMVGSGEQERPTVHGLIGRFKYGSRAMAVLVDGSTCRRNREFGALIKHIEDVLDDPFMLVDDPLLFFDREGTAMGRAGSVHDDPQDEFWGRRLRWRIEREGDTSCRGDRRRWIDPSGGGLVESEGR